MAFRVQSDIWVKRGLAPQACRSHCEKMIEEHTSDLKFYKCYQYENGNSDNLISKDFISTDVSCSGMSTLRDKIIITII